MPNMRMAASGLGVMCTFCHVEDRSSDEKQEKLTARMMFAMVKDLNSKFPDGKEHVTCYTCHRGAEMPLTARSSRSVTCFCPASDSRGIRRRKCVRGLFLRRPAIIRLRHKANRMKLIIDTDSGVLTTEKYGIFEDLPLYSREAFERISREWVRTGWAVNYYFTMSWFGRPVLQLPEDLIRLQEVVYALKPDVIVESGIHSGGSLLFHATLCEALGQGRVIGIDKHIAADTRDAIAQHRLAHRIETVEGDSIAPATVEKVYSRVQAGERVLVILDSHHSKDHVAAELRAYAPLVTPGSCIVAADGIMRDLTDVPGGDPDWAWDNPAAAALEFAAEHAEFEMRQPKWPFNRSELERNITYWPDGWLWRKAKA